MPRRQIHRRSFLISSTDERIFRDVEPVKRYNLLIMLGICLISFFVTFRASLRLCLLPTKINIIRIRKLRSDSYLYYGRCSEFGSHEQRALAVKIEMEILHIARWFPNCSVFGENNMHIYKQTNSSHRR